MHHLVLAIALLPEESQLITLQYHEVLLVALGLSFEIAVTGVLDDIFF